jgi:hypothetical protein
MSPVDSLPSNVEAAITWQYRKRGHIVRSCCVSVSTPKRGPGNAPAFSDAMASDEPYEHACGESYMAVKDPLSSQNRTSASGMSVALRRSGKGSIQGDYDY